MYQEEKKKKSSKPRVQYSFWFSLKIQDIKRARSYVSCKLCACLYTCREMYRGNNPIFNTVPRRDGSKAGMKLANFFIILLTCYDEQTPLW